jgi:L-alanine-DL-glutamate epimerase-like enolase superfamily enzyme
MTPRRQLEVDLARWALREPFAISRHVFQDSLVLTIGLREGPFMGRGECEPHEHEQLIGLEAQADALRLASRPGWLEGLSRSNIVDRMPCTPLRNALDCAIWDLESQQRGCRAWELEPELAQRVGDALPVTLTPTVALDTPARMGSAAAACRAAPYLKLKLGGGDGLDGERLEAVSAGFGGGPLVVDVNGGWTPAGLRSWLPLMNRLNVAVLEQPLQPGWEADLPSPPGSLRYCADESCTDRRSLPEVARSYQMINVKLDKTGGLTEALALIEAATREGLPWMVGSNGGTSLAMAPLYMLAHGALLVDAGVGHLTQDRCPALDVCHGLMHAPSPQLWG